MCFLQGNNMLVSTAQNDRILNAWKLDTKTTATVSSAIASFTINEGPVFMDAVITAGSIRTADDDDVSA